MSTKVNLLIEQGCDFNESIELIDVNEEDLNVTNFTANAQLRKYYGATNKWDFTATLANGSVTLSMGHVTTASIDAGRYVYDVVLNNTVSNTVSRLIEGIATVTPQVVR